MRVTITQSTSFQYIPRERAGIIAVFFFLLLLSLSFVSPSISQTPLTLNERIHAQEKIERVYYNHRIWPNPSPKPSFEQMVPRSVIEKKVNDSLSVRITPEMLQAELNRIAKTTKDPAMLLELFSALNNDPIVIAETLVRSSVAQRMIRGNKFVSSKRKIKKFRLPEIKTDASCGGWDVLDASNPPSDRSRHTAIWTGTEMIVWGGANDSTGGRYDPALNTWTPTSTGQNCPSARYDHTAVWTGTEMIIWGGRDGSGAVVDTGGRYDPSTDTWAITSVGMNVPEARALHTAVWTGSEMIIWGGGQIEVYELNTGGRYDPSSDTWQPTSIGIGGRVAHTAVWTGQEMIIWGGIASIFPTNTGGRYNPLSDSWLPTSDVNVPIARRDHKAIWTGSEMIIWGGTDGIGFGTTNTGGKYDPIVDEWQATSAVGAPFERTYHTAVWTGTEMIIWGGRAELSEFTITTATGGRYSLANDTWLGTAIGMNAPSDRNLHTVVWTGTKMIIFGGSGLTGLCPTKKVREISNTGAIYSPENDNIVVNPSTLPNPEKNVFYSQIISASGGTPPYNLEFVEGCLDYGLTFDESSGVISGTPYQAGVNTLFAITATDANSCPGTQSYQIYYCNEMIFSPPSLPNGQLGIFYNQTITLDLAHPSFSVTAGVLPDGLTLDGSTGVISGTPTALGTFSFTITGGNYGCFKSHDYTIKITLATHN